MKPISLEVTLDLTHPWLADPRAGVSSWLAARALRLLADQIAEGGLCPGGVWGGVIPCADGSRIGYWVVRAEEAPGSP